MSSIKNLFGSPFNSILNQHLLFNKKIKLKIIIKTQEKKLRQI